jgi:hypothetical protein
MVAPLQLTVRGKLAVRRERDDETFKFRPRQRLTAIIIHESQ